MSEILATAKQKVQHLESMIGFVDIEELDRAMLVEIINIYKAGNEPLYSQADMKWLNKCVDKYTEALRKYNEIVIGVADGDASFPNGEKIIFENEVVAA